MVMEMVEMIIKIPEEARARLAFGVTYTQDIQTVCDAISEGIILPKPITYADCANAMMKMWIDNVLTDRQYNAIMDKLNAKYKAGDIDGSC